MADEIKQLVDMVARLKIAVDDGFALMNKKFNEIEAAVSELNTNQIKILNSIKLIVDDVDNNRRHIERIENRENFL